MGTVHIAGLDVRVGTKYRQRCAWCEAVLVDGDLACEAVPEGQKNEPKFYALATLVDVTKDGPFTRFVTLPPADKLPPNACIGPPKLRVIEGGAP